MGALFQTTYGASSNIAAHSMGKDVSRAEWQSSVRARIGKQRINIMLDAPIVEHFKAVAGERGYQTIINDTLRRVIETGILEADLRRIISEELAHHS